VVANAGTFILDIAWIVLPYILLGVIRALPAIFRNTPNPLMTTNKENGMNKVSVQMEVPKESKEVIDCLVGLLADIKAKKSMGEIAGGALQKVIIAVEGFDQLSEELKSDGKDELAGYAVQQILAGLGV